MLAHYFIKYRINGAPLIYGALLLLGVQLLGITGFAQVSGTVNIPDSTIGKPLNDTTSRILDVSDKLLLSSGLLAKSYSIEVKNIEQGTSLSINPAGSMNMGFGINYRWLGVAFSFGLPTLSNEADEKGETQKQDLQLHIYSNAVVAQGHLQHYKGFHISNVGTPDTSIVELENGEAILSSLETYSLGISSWYFFNHKKFSYKAAYVRNAIQKKSAGSIVAGLYYGVDRASANDVLGENLPDSITGDFNVLGYTSQNYGVSLGYSYTFVIKNFFINGTLVPGLGVKNVSLVSPSETYYIDEGLTGRLSFNMAVGYEAEHFILGLRAFTSSRFFEAEGYRFNTGTNSLSVYIGKRFDVGNIIKKFK